MEYSDIERAVNTILGQTTPRHHILRLWVHRLANEPTYHEHIETFELGADDVNGPTWVSGSTWDDVLAGCAEEGMVTDLPRLAEHIVNLTAGPAATNPDGEPYPPELRLFSQRRDAAIYHLATALVQYRRDGRPDGDIERPIRGMGGEPLVTVSTSLAAAVAEYVRRVEDAYATRCRTLERP